MIAKSIDKVIQNSRLNRGRCNRVDVTQMGGDPVLDVGCRFVNIKGSNLVAVTFQASGRSRTNAGSGAGLR